MAKKKTTSKKKEVTGLDIAMQSITKKYGDVVKVMADRPLIIETISTQSLRLDAALGRGGVAKGRVYEIFGPPSGGKTTLTMSVIAEAQRKGMTCAFVDAEHAADPQLFSQMGVDINKLLLIEGFSGEENLDAAEVIIKTGEIDLLIIYSVTALIPKAEAEADIGKDFMALLARLMSKALRKIVPIAGKTDTCVIFINQIRHDIMKWGNTEVTSGGEALEFYSTGRIRVSGVEKKDNRIENEHGEVIGHKTKFEILKNKLAAPFRTAEVDLYYGTGYDRYGEVLDIAVELALLGKSGAWYSVDGKNFAQGRDKARYYLMDNEELYNKLHDGIVEMIGLKEYYDEQK